MTRSDTASPWIASPWFDTVFFIGTPLLCLLGLLPLRGHFSSQDIFLVVMAFSSFGHHLPGFLRAYGDAELFRRFRWRFILAPPLIYGTCLFFGRLGLHGMLLILMLWSIWHVMMQHYGFMRIYDAKVGSTEPRTARLDYWLSLLGFVSIVLLSPQYSHNIIDRLYESSHFVIPLGVFRGLQWAVWIATGIVGAAYVLHAGRRIARGEPFSLIKVILLVITLSFLYFVWVSLGDLYLGLAVWEVFHDIQYFAITFLYNRKLVTKGLGTTRFMKFFFRQRLSMISIYGFAILLYGSLNYVIATKTSSTLQTTLMAFVFTSTLLHYYYDGFIWKVRQSRTRQGLDLDDAPESKTVIINGSRPRSSWSNPPMLRRMAHVALFAIPIGSLAAMELSRSRMDEVAYRQALRDIVPSAVESYLNLGTALDRSGRGSEALEAFEQAVSRGPKRAEAHSAYAVALLEYRGSEKEADATSHLQKAIELDPSYGDAMLNLAILSMHRGAMNDALDWYRKALATADLLPANPETEALSGWDFLEQGRLVAAEERFVRALELKPDHLEALEGLAWSLESSDPGRSLAIISRLIDNDPSRRDLHVRSIALLLRLARVDEALEALEIAVEQSPENRDLKLNLAEFLATNASQKRRDGKRAVLLASEVVDYTKRENAGAMDILGAAYAESGDFEKAIEFATLALNKAKEQRLGGALSAIEARLQGYRDGRPYHAPPIEAR